MTPSARRPSCSGRRGAWTVGIEHKGPGAAGVGIKAAIGQQQRGLGLAQGQAHIEALAHLQRRWVAVEQQLDAEAAVLDLGVDAGDVEPVLAALVLEHGQPSRTRPRWNSSSRSSSLKRPRLSSRAMRVPARTLSPTCSVRPVTRPPTGARTARPSLAVRMASSRWLRSATARCMACTDCSRTASSPRHRLAAGHRAARPCSAGRPGPPAPRATKSRGRQLAVALVQSAHALQLELAFRQRAAQRRLGLHPRGAQGRSWPAAAPPRWSAPSAPARAACCSAPPATARPRPVRRPSPAPARRGRLRSRQAAPIAAAAPGRGRRPRRGTRRPWPARSPSPRATATPRGHQRTSSTSIAMAATAPSARRP